MAFISYAPNFEDVMLWRALRHVEHGFYVDVGAGEPETGSVTRAFYERGWHGVNLEPARAQHAALRIARPADVNLALAAAAVAGPVTVYDVTGTPLSTLDQAQARAHGAAGMQVVQRQVDADTLSAVCERHAAGAIHFMKLAAAGQEQAVLAGLDLARWRPWLLVVAGASAPAWRQGVLDAGYVQVYDDGISLFFAAAEHAALGAAFATPPNRADGFALRAGHDYAFPLTRWNERIAELEGQARLAEQRAQEARDWADARVREYTEPLAELTGRATVAEKALSEEHARAELAQWEAQQQAARAERAEAQVNYLDGTLNGVVQSMSWRLTRPLRAANVRAKAWRFRLGALRQRVVQRAARAAGAARGLLRRLLVRAAHAVMSRPALSFFVRRQVSRFPRLANWLRATVLRTRQGQAAAATAPAPELNHLPASARHVLDDLRRKMQNARNP